MQTRAAFLFAVILVLAFAGALGQQQQQQQQQQQKDGSIDDETLRALFQRLNEAQAEKMRVLRDRQDISTERTNGIDEKNEEDGYDDESPNYIDLLADLIRTTSDGMPPSARVMKHRDVMRKVWLMYGAFRCVLNVGLAIGIPLVLSSVVRRVGLTGWKVTALRGITTGIIIYYRGPFVLQYAIIILGRLL